MKTPFLENEDHFRPEEAKVEEALEQRVILVLICPRDTDLWQLELTSELLGQIKGSMTVVNTCILWGA